MKRTHTHTYHLTAGECDATGHMPITLVAERVIEVATEHANELGIGYTRLKELGIGWVLSRLSIEMYRYPGINDVYSLTTWIETINRKFSERNMTMHDGQGAVIGHMRTVWVAIDFQKRTMADLSSISDVPLPLGDLPCPIAKHPRLAIPAAGCIEYPYTFRYCDLDFNRHVNTVRYIDLILNRWPLAHYDENMLKRIDVTFSHECYFADTVLVRAEQEGEINHCELLRENQRMVAARLVWQKRGMQCD